jgi:hypothetical protein
MIDELRRMRRDALRLNSSVLEHLKTFQQKDDDSFVTLPPPFSKPRAQQTDISVGSTCTALMALLATKTQEKLWSKKEDAQKKTKIDILGLFKGLVRAKWESSGLLDGNAFTTALVIRTAGFLVKNKILTEDQLADLKHDRYKSTNDKGEEVIDPEVADKSLKEIIESKAQFKEKDPITKAEQAPFSVSGYPRKASIGYWFVDGAINAGSGLGANLEKIAEWGKVQFHSQLIYLSAGNDSLMDPPELAMAACLINRIHRLCNEKDELAYISRSLPSPVELDFAVQRVLCEQPEAGIWHKYFPLFHFPRGGGAADYCFSFEFLEAVLVEFGTSLLRKLDLLHHFQRSLTWCDRHILRYVTSGDEYIGWNSGGEVKTLAAGAPEAWATAAVHMFLNQLHLKISELLDDLVLKNSFGKDRTATAHELKDKLKGQIDAQVLFPNEPSTTLLTVIESELIDNAQRSEGSDPFELAVPRSALLFGPPGTAKTSLANAIAEYLGWPIVTITPSNFLSSGLEHVHAEVDKVFTDLMDLSKTVVFFDEMDALARTRENSPEDESKNPLDMTSLLLTTSMLPKLADLWKKAGVIFLMATNHRQHLDPAITRAQRFDLLLCVAPPPWSYKNAGDKLKNVLGIENAVDVEDKLNDLVAIGSTTEMLLDRFTVSELGIFFDYLRRANNSKDLIGALAKYENSSEFAEAVAEWAKDGIALSKESTKKEYKDDVKASRRQYYRKEKPPPTHVPLLATSKPTGKRKRKP